MVERIEDRAPASDTGTRGVDRLAQPVDAPRARGTRASILHSVEVRQQRVHLGAPTSEVLDDRPDGTRAPGAEIHDPLLFAGRERLLELRRERCGMPGEARSEFQIRGAGIAQHAREPRLVFELERCTRFIAGTLVP
jgi:hypothetical protein